MRTAPDGSPVELYRRLPPRADETALVHDLLAGGGSVLDLGCGTGRLAEPLAELGHPVTGVDNEPGMLAELRRSTGVQADITTLDLPTRFDAVLLMSHFVNDADTQQVVSLLRVVRRHTRDSGFAIVERYRPGWVETCTGSTREADGVRFTLTDLDRAGDVLTATMRYEFDGHRAEQRFSTRDLDDARLSELATAAGLRLDRSLYPTRTRVPSGTIVILRPLAQDNDRPERAAAPPGFCLPE